MSTPYAGSLYITDAAGLPINGAQVFTYEAGTLAPKAVYTTSALDVAHPNPVVASNGRATLYLGAGSYRIRVTDADGVALPAYDDDNVSAEYSASGVAFTPASTIAATNVQAAIEEVNAEVRAALAAVDGFGASSVRRQTLVATTGQTDFTLTGLSYVMGINSLAVTVGGLMVPASDITELTTTSFRLAAGLPAGTEVEAFVGSFVSGAIQNRQIAGATGIAEHQSGGATDQASYFFRRRATYSGGTPGFANAAVWVDTFVESSIGSAASTATAYEWALVSVMRNYAADGENSALYAQGLKYSTGPTWAGVLEAIDWTATANPTTGLVGLEIDTRANGTDTNLARVGLDVVATRPYTAGVPAGDAMVTSYGVRLQNGGDASASYGIGFSVGGSTAGTTTAVVGFDTSAATITQAAYKMASGQAIAFVSDASRKLYHDGTGLRFADGSNTIIARFTDSGALQTAAGVQVVGARNTGWGAMTGTTNKATVYDTATVTTAQLAGRVMALQEALTTHGLIGA